VILFESVLAAEPADPIVLAASALMEAVLDSEEAYSPSDVLELVEAMLFCPVGLRPLEALGEKGNPFADGGPAAKGAKPAWDAAEGKKVVAALKAEMKAAKTPAAQAAVRGKTLKELRVELSVLGMELKKSNVAHMKVAPLALALAFVGADFLDGLAGPWFEGKAKSAAAEKIDGEVKGSKSANQVKALVLALKALAKAPAKEDKPAKE
jgi:hypothetical protein